MAALFRRQEDSDRVGEFLAAACNLIEAPWGIALIADDVAAHPPPEPMRPGVQQTGFVQAMVAAAETVAAEPIAPASGRMAIEIEKNRRVIVDVDAAALALAILEWLA